MFNGGASRSWVRWETVAPEPGEDDEDDEEPDMPLPPPPAAIYGAKSNETGTSSLRNASIAALNPDDPERVAEAVDGVTAAEGIGSGRRGKPLGVDVVGECIGDSSSDMNRFAIIRCLIAISNLALLAAINGFVDGPGSGSGSYAVAVGSVTVPDTCPIPRVDGAADPYVATVELDDDEEGLSGPDARLSCRPNPNGPKSGSSKNESGGILGWGSIGADSEAVGPPRPPLGRLSCKYCIVERNNPGLKVEGSRRGGPVKVADELECPWLCVCAWVTLGLTAMPVPPIECPDMIYEGLVGSEGGGRVKDAGNGRTGGPGSAGRFTISGRSGGWRCGGGGVALGRN